MHRYDPLPLRVLPSRHAWPLHDVAGSRLIEAFGLAREPNGKLMRRAGHAVARWVAALAPHARHVWLACGPGGNGGDGLHAAAVLARHGREVHVSLHAEAARLPPDATQALQDAREAGVRIAPTPPDRPVDVAVDALLGMGSRPEPQGALLDAALALGRCAARRLAIDLPTGLQPDTGQASKQGQVHVEATLALLTLRPGMFTGDGRDVCGQIWLDTLGAEQDDAWQDTARARLTHDSEHPACWIHRPHASHKGRFGDVHIVGGAHGMTGAARLAASAALAAGAGRILLTLLDPTAPRGDASRPEWLWRPPEERAPPDTLESATLVIGCGGGETIDAHLSEGIARAARLVLDADALNTLARHPALARAVRQRSARDRPTIMTPHPLEAARLLGCETSAVQGDRLRAARALAEAFGATVVLKGSGSVVATVDQRMAINATGGPALASGGSGDVLAGWIGGLWSQARAAPTRLTSSATAHAVACSASWLHGSAADLHPQHLALRGLDLVEAMRLVPMPR